MTTATVEINREVAAALAAKGADFADGPVARGVPAAENGTLAITVGASDAVFERIKPYLACMGTEISHCGGIGTGQVLKLMNNMLIFQTVTALAEAMAIATRAGVDRARVFEILSRGSADSYCMRKHGSHMTTGKYPDDQFPITYSLKDLRYALSLADTVGVDAESAKLAEKKLLEAIDKGYGNLYSPALYKLFDDSVA
jgi:3-hydroxyisobutyrate dehydrogenase-like beta-hydroxyacid dehydrogenase